MRPLRQQKFYELLEVPPEATLQEIARAYKIARATYQPSSTSTYSVYSDEENRDILRRVDEGYVVLSDARLRGEYDARLGRAEIDARGEAPVVADAPEDAARAVYPSHTPEADLELEESIEPEDGVFDGAVLRRIRLSRGVELDDISERTKINETYLRFIEDERYADLPSPVYVRGFLVEYAKSLRLDPRKVTESYLERLRKRTGSRP